jgi:uncharacterized protein
LIHSLYHAIAEFSVTEKVVRIIHFYDFFKKEFVVASEGLRTVSSVTEFDVDAHMGPFPSPCCGVCRVHPDTGLCEGCFRSMDEIIAWGRASEATKRHIWLKVQQRACLKSD